MAHLAHKRPASFEVVAKGNPYPVEVASKLLDQHEEHANWLERSIAQFEAFPDIDFQCAVCRQTLTNDQTDAFGAHLPCSLQVQRDTTQLDSLAQLRGASTMLTLQLRLYLYYYDDRRATGVQNAPEPDPAATKAFRDRISALLFTASRKLAKYVATLEPYALYNCVSRFACFAAGPRFPTDPPLSS